MTSVTSVSPKSRAVETFSPKSPATGLSLCFILFLAPELRKRRRDGCHVLVTHLGEMLRIPRQQPQKQTQLSHHLGSPARDHTKPEFTEVPGLHTPFPRASQFHVESGYLLKMTYTAPSLQGSFPRNERPLSIFSSGDWNVWELLLAVLAIFKNIIFTKSLAPPAFI